MRPLKRKLTIAQRIENAYRQGFDMGYIQGEESIRNEIKGVLKIA